MKTNGRKLLIIDVDDVLLDWTSSFGSYIEEHYDYKDGPLGDDNRRLWEILDIPKDDVVNIMREHNESEFFKHLEYFNDSNNLNDCTYFDKIICLTSCGTEIDVIKSRRENLNNKFPDKINELICLPYYSHKMKHIDMIKNNYNEYDIYLLDDNINDVEYALTKDIKAYVYHSSFYNSDKLPKVYNMSEFISKVLSDDVIEY